MKVKRRGLDYWRLDFNFQVFLNTAKTKDWQIYEVQQDEFITFYSSLIHRADIIKTYPSIIHVKTTGILGMLCRTLKRSDRLLAIILSVILWFILSSTIFNIQILGDGAINRELIQNQLTSLNYTTPFLLNDKQLIKKDLVDHLKDEFSWIEVEQTGSLLKVRFLPKEKIELEVLNRNELYARKDGVIAKFELYHGEKVVKLNQVVKAGDLLVRNTLMDSRNQEEALYVKGKVYAYTWKDFEIQIEDNQMPDAIQFFQLLFQARNYASEGLREDEKIISENILQFTKINDKIMMKCHYTLLENISG